MNSNILVFRIIIYKKFILLTIKVYLKLLLLFKKINRLYKFK